MNKLCRNVLVSCLTVSLATGEGIAVSAASTTSIEYSTAVAGIAVSLDNYYASSQTPEADIVDYIRNIVSASEKKKTTYMAAADAKAKKNVETSLASEDASEKEEGLVSVMASLNVRNKPSVSSSVIGYLYSNCVVTIYDTVENDEGSWYRIKSGAVEGYVSSDYVLTGAAAKASEEDLTNRYAKVTANSATVYSSASSSADSVGSVYKDGDYKVLEIQNGFVKIIINEEFAGFVRTEDVSLYTRHAEAVAITDQMVKNQLDSYLVDIRDAEAIFEKRMAIADYQAAYNASTYAYQLWEYYISDASNAGYTDLVADAQSEQKKTAEMVARATAALNGETIPETSSATSTTASAEAQTTSRQSEASTEASTPASSTSQEEASPTQPGSSSASDQTDNVTSTNADETTSAAAEDTTSTTAEDNTQDVIKTIQSVTACYTGSSKTEGEVISASELYIIVTYVDGTMQTVTEGLNCDQIGRQLSAGVNTITVSYRGFSSSFDLNVAKIEPSSDTQPSPSNDTSSETASEDTTTSTEEQTTAATAGETTVSTTEEQTTATTAGETTVSTTEEQTTTTTAEETTISTTEEQTMTTTAEETVATSSEEITTTQESTTSSESTTPLRDAVVSYALSWVGQCNYVYGGTDLSVGGSVDCSGFTMQVYSRVTGITLPHHSMSQMNYGSAITYDQLRPGDLVFYNNPNHVAIYIGNGAIVHAGSPETGINTASVFFKAPIGYRTYLP